VSWFASVSLRKCRVVPRTQPRPVASRSLPIHQPRNDAILFEYRQHTASQLSRDAAHVTDERTGPAQHLYACSGGCLFVEDARYYYLGVTMHALLRTCSLNCENRVLASSRVCPSVRLHGITRFPLHEFTSYFIFEYFSEICRENSSFTVM
jgi:hypothetical protein